MKLVSTCQRSVFTCCFTLCSWKHGDAWHVLTLPNARSTGLRPGACTQPSKRLLPLPAVGRGVRKCSQAPPLPQGQLAVSPGGPRSTWIEGGEVLILTPTLTMPAPWPVDGDAERGGCSQPGMHRGHGAGRTHPGEMKGVGPSMLCCPITFTYKRQIQREKEEFQDGSHRR